MFISFFIINFTSTRFNKNTRMRETFNKLPFYKCLTPWQKKLFFWKFIRRSEISLNWWHYFFCLPLITTWYLCAKLFLTTNEHKKKLEIFLNLNCAWKWREKKSKSKVHCSCLLKFLHTNSERRHNNRHLVKRERESEKW